MTSIEELEKQKAALEELIEREKGKAEAKDKVLSLIDELGYTFDELFGSEKIEEPIKRKKAKPMYMHPKNHRKTWAGPDSGRPQPKWLVDELENGAKLHDFLISY